MIHNDFEEYCMNSNGLKVNYGWIDAFEELPKEDEYYSVCMVEIFNDYVFEGLHEEEIVIPAYFMSEEKLWKIDSDFYINALVKPEDKNGSCCYVSHWQPLPEKPGIHNV